MSLLFAVLCGLIQGLTEFLPISSSGHLAIFQNVFGMENFESSYLTFDILLHLGTLTAVFIMYYKDVLPLFPAFFTMLGKLFKGKFKLSCYNTNERLVIMVITATLPLILMIFIKNYVEILTGYTLVIGCILIFNGLVLLVSDKMSRSRLNAQNVKPRNAIIVGLCQACAVLPGLSRSGSTITGGLAQGFERGFAVKFSFILSIPAIIGANIISVPDVINNPIPSTDVVPYIAGTITALFCGIAAMKLLIYISKKSNFRVFSYYCFVIGIIGVILGASDL